MEKLKKHLKDNVSLYLIGIYAVTCASLTGVYIYTNRTPRYPFGSDSDADSRFASLSTEAKMEIEAAIRKAFADKAIPLTTSS